MKKRFLIIVMTLSMIISALPGVYAAESAADVTRTEMINTMLEKEVVSNMSDGEYHPDDNMTKKDFLAMAAALFRMEENSTENLLSGVTACNRVRELDDNASITHEQAAAVLYNAFVYAYEYEPDGVCDMKDFTAVSSCAQHSAKAMWIMGFTKTDSDFFYPSKPITRGEAAEVAYKMFYTDAAYTCKNGPGTYEDDEIATEVREAYARGARKVIVQPGTYYLYNSSGASYGQVAHFTLEGMKDFTLEGYNVKFIGCTPADDTASGDKDMRMALFTYCEDFTVRGFTMDFIHPIFTQGRIVTVDTQRWGVGYIEVEIDEGYPNQLDDRAYFEQNLAIYIFDPDTHKLKPGVPSMNLYGATKVEGYERRWRLRNYESHNQQHYKVGDQFATRMVGCTPMNTRFAQCRNITLEDYTVEGGCFGVLMEPSMRVEGKDNTTVLRNVKITYGDKPEGATEERLVSTYADGIHLSYMSGDILMEDCVVEGNLDDTYALNGRYYVVGQTASDTVDSEGNELDTSWQLNDNQLIIGTQFYGNVIKPGDLLACYDRMCNYLGSVTVKSTEWISGANVEKAYVPASDASNVNGYGMNEWQIIEVDDASIVKRLDYMMDTDASAGKFVMRNCIGRDTKGRGLLAQNWNGLVENCLFERVAGSGVALTGETNCAQGPYTKDVIIKNSKFIECGYSGNNGTGMFFTLPALTTAISESGRANVNVVVDSCYFADNYGKDVEIGNTKHAIITNNIFGRQNPSADGKSYGDAPSVKISNSEDIYFDESNTALTDRTLLSYQDVDNFYTEHDAKYSSDLIFLGENKSENEWSYEYAKIGTNDFGLYNFCSIAEGSWVATTPLWSQDQKENTEYGYFRSANEAVPGSAYDIIETFTAPFDGKIKIKLKTGVQIRSGVENDDGVYFYIMKNDDALWPQAGKKFISWTSPIEYIEPVETEVKKGDKIRFRLNCNTAATNDYVVLKPEIEYIRTDTAMSEPERKDFTLSEQYLVKKLGDTVELIANGGAENITWSSSREEVAVVDSNGKVTLKYPGMATITAKSGDKEATCIIAVSGKLNKGIAFTSKAVKASKGETITLPLDTADGVDASKIKLKSSDDKKIKINDDGTISVLTSDTCEVTVTAEYEEYKSEITVCIKN
ncbi:MAG: Ig domain-containing protein [Monoglobaceae bacterium]